MMANGLSYEFDPEDERYVTVGGRRLLRVRGADDTEDTDDDDSGNPEDHVENDIDDDDDDAVDDDDDDDDDDDYVRVPKEQVDEHNRLRRERAQAAREQRQAERRRAEEEGRFKDIASDAERERDEAIARADAAEFELEAFKRRQTVTSAASELGFHDPEMVFQIVPEDQTESADTLNRYLRKLAREKPFLVGDPPPGGRAMNGGRRKKETPEDGLTGSILSVMEAARGEQT